MRTGAFSLIKIETLSNLRSNELGLGRIKYFSTFPALIDLNMPMKQMQTKLLLSSSSTTRFLVGSLLLLSSCQDASKRDNDVSRYTILNDLFLQITDTVAYRYNSFYPSNELVPTKISDSTTITVYYRLLNIRQWEKSIEASLTDTEKLWIKLFNQLPRDTTNIPLDVRQLSNTGRYKLIAISNPHLGKMDNVAGHLRFSTVLHNDSIGLVVVEKMNNIKGGRTILYLFKKDKSKWWVEREDILRYD